MKSLLMSSLISIIFIIIILKTKPYHIKYTKDFTIGPQKIHSYNAPRIGGLAVFISLILTLFIKYIENDFIILKDYEFIYYFILCSLPVFFIGIIEDLTKKITANIRLLFILFSSALSIYLLPIDLNKFNYYNINTVLFTVTSFIFFSFSITGLTNAYNIIDGFNGLTSMIAILVLASITYVCFKNNDYQLMYLSIILIGSLIGFFIFNYPYGFIFLGDCGAYLIGYSIAIISILLVQRNISVSPLYALVVNAYPIIETIFSIWRRNSNGRKSITKADGIHFHSLIYRRILGWTINSNVKVINNAITSFVIWAFSILIIAPSTICWNNYQYLLLFFILFCLYYIYLYFKIIKFKFKFKFK